MMTAPVTAGALLFCMLLAGCAQSAADPGPVEQPSEASPVQEAADPELLVSASPFQARYSFRGSTARSTAVSLQVPRGMAFLASVKDGAAVSAGQPIGSLTIPSKDRPDLVAAAASSTVAASRLAALEALQGDLAAPVAGELVLGGTVPQIASAGLDATAALNPLQDLRLQGMRFEASLEVEDLFGYRTAGCVTWWVEATESGPLLRCRIPVDVQTAEGLPVKIAMRSPAQEVIAVPARFIGYDPGGGGSFIVQRLGADAQAARVPVVVGPTDGVRRVLLAGVAAGDRLAPFDEGQG